MFQPEACKHTAAVSLADFADCSAESRLEGQLSPQRLMQLQEHGGMGYAYPVWDVNVCQSSWSRGILPSHRQAHNGSKDSCTCWQR